MPLPLPRFHAPYSILAHQRAQEFGRSGQPCRQWLIAAIRGAVGVRTVYIAAVQARAGNCGLLWSYACDCPRLLAI